MQYDAYPSELYKEYIVDLNIVRCLDAPISHGSAHGSVIENID